MMPDEWIVNDEQTWGYDPSDDLTWIPYITTQVIDWLSEYKGTGTAARLSDIWTGICCCHSKPTCRSMGGTIITGSANTISGSLGQANITSMTIGWCGHSGFIVTGSPNCLSNSLGKAIFGSMVAGCNQGTIITGNVSHNIN